MDQQEKLIDWERVEEQRERNKGNRESWKRILGMSLNKKVALFLRAGFDGYHIYYDILKDHPELTEDQQRKLQIGISARIGEQGIVRDLDKKTTD